MTRHVDTRYGPMPGCPDCGVIVLGNEPHLCEHGVTPALAPITITGTVTIEDPEVYRRLLNGGKP